MVAPVPSVERAEVAMDEAGWLHWGAKRLEPAPLPDELVIRELLDLDLGQPGREPAALDFVQNHGVISVPHPEVKPPGRRRKDGPNHIFDVGTYLHDAQRLARHWITYMDDGYVAPLWMQAEYLKSRRGRRQAEADEREAWGDFVSLLNEGLRPFHARAEVVVPGADGTSVTWGQLRPVGLYSALCLQLLNLVTEAEPLRTCASETCGHRFVRQRGGAKHGQYRMRGVMYCTPSCAQAQKQREYRRRNKKEQRS